MFHLTRRDFILRDLRSANRRAALSKFPNGFTFHAALAAVSVSVRSELTAFAVLMASSDLAISGLYKLCSFCQL